MAGPAVVIWRELDSILQFAKHELFKACSRERSKTRENSIDCTECRASRIVSGFVA